MLGMDLCGGKICGLDIGYTPPFSLTRVSSPKKGGMSLVRENCKVDLVLREDWWLVRICWEWICARGRFVVWEKMLRMVFYWMGFLEEGGTGKEGALMFNFSR